MEETSAPSPIGQPMAATPQPAGAPNMSGLTPAGQVLKEAWQFYKTKFWTMLGLSAIPIVVTIVGLLIVAGSTTGGDKIAGTGAAAAGFGISMLIYVIALIIASIISSAAMILVAKHKNEQIGVGAALKMAKPMFWSYLLVSIISGLIIAVGLILLIIPGIIFALWYGFSTYVVLDQGKKGMAALAESKRLASGRMGALLWRWVVLILISFLLGLISGIIGGILGDQVGPIFSNVVQWILTPLFVVYGYLVYEDFKKTRPA